MSDLSSFKNSVFVFEKNKVGNIVTFSPMKSKWFVQWGIGGTNPIRGADTQLGDDGVVESHANVNFQSFRKNLPYFYDGNVGTFSLNVKVLALNIHNRSEWTQSNDFEIKIPTETYSIKLINMTIFTLRQSNVNVMPCEWRIWNDVVALSGRKWRHMHWFSPSCASAPPFVLVFTPVPHWYKILQTDMENRPFNNKM
jgi:hypothetical protein